MLPFGEQTEQPSFCDFSVHQSWCHIALQVFSHFPAVALYVEECDVAVRTGSDLGYRRVMYALRSYRQPVFTSLANAAQGGATFVAILSKGGDSAPSSEEIPAEAPVESAAAGVEAAGEAAGVTAGAEAPATTEKAPAAAAAATPEEAEAGAPASLQAGAPAPSSASPAVPSTAAAAALVSSPLPLPVADQAAPTKLHTAAHRSPVASYAPTAVAASAASAARDAHAASDARDAAAVPGTSGGNTEADGTDHNDSSDGDVSVSFDCVFCGEYSIPIQ